MLNDIKVKQTQDIIYKNNKSGYKTTKKHYINSMKKAILGSEGEN